MWSGSLNSLDKNESKFSSGGVKVSTGFTVLFLFTNGLRHYVNDGQGLNSFDPGPSGVNFSLGGVKVSTGFTKDKFARPGSAGLVKKRKRITANNVIHADFSRNAAPVALAA